MLHTLPSPAALPSHLRQAYIPFTARRLMDSHSPWEGWGAGGICVRALLDQGSISAGCRSRAQQVPVNPQQLHLYTGTAGMSLQRWQGGGGTGISLPTPRSCLQDPSSHLCMALPSPVGRTTLSRDPLFCAEEESAKQECPKGGFGGNWGVGRARRGCWGWSKLLWQRKELRTRVRPFPLVVGIWNRGKAHVGVLPEGTLSKSFGGVLRPSPPCTHLPPSVWASSSHVCPAVK